MCTCTTCMRLWNGPWREKICHRCLQTTKAQTSLRIRAVWSAPVSFAYWKVSHLNFLQANFQFSSPLVPVADTIGLSLNLSETPKTGFVASKPKSMLNQGITMLKESVILFVLVWWCFQCKNKPPLNVIIVHLFFGRFTCKLSPCICNCT